MSKPLGVRKGVPTSSTAVGNGALLYGCPRAGEDVKKWELASSGRYEKMHRSRSCEAAPSEAERKCTVGVMLIRG